MAKVKQIIKITAKNKKNPKYKVTKSVKQSVKVVNGKKVTKHAYTRKINKNGKSIYYYS